MPPDDVTSRDGTPVGPPQRKISVECRQDSERAGTSQLTAMPRTSQLGRKRLESSARVNYWSSMRTSLYGPVFPSRS